MTEFSKFAQFVADTKAKHRGHDIAGNPRQYIPRSALDEYWSKKNISLVLASFSPRLNFDVGVIKRQYLRIFSTLVYTGRDTVESLADLFISRNLSDEKLPWRSRPSEWPDELFFRDFFAGMAKHQWQFFPLPFHPDQLHDHRIHDERILPINWGTQIAHGTAASVHAFEIHPEFNHLAPKRTFVFKVYHNEKHEASYEDERNALQRLSANPSPNLVKFYGSLRQLGSSCLILEYVDGGNLGDFFDNCDRPPTVDDVVMFWKSLFQVFAGLDRIHQSISNEDKTIMGIHEDIRPENILLMKGSTGSPYDFTPKVADFGLYSRVRTAQARSGGMKAGLDRCGNQRFSAPECSHHITQRYTEMNMVTTAADIFSIGAVLSHTAAWVVGGREEQTTYFEDRKAYHERELPRFKRSGYEGCFHNSIEPLPVVAEQHQKTRERCQPSDDVTPKVIDWMERHMLVQPPGSRWRARDILEKFEEYMESRSLPSPYSPPTAVSDMTLQSSCWSVPAVSSPSTMGGLSPPAAAPAGVGSGPVHRPALKVVVSPHGSDVTAPTTSRPSPQLPPDNSASTIPPPPLNAASLSPSTHARQAGDFSQSSTSAAGPSPTSSTTPKPGPKIGIAQINRYQLDLRNGHSPDADTAILLDHLKYNYSGRDQLFFIDDSHSMGAHRDAVAAGFRALAFIAAKLDPNRVELAFASRPRKVHRAWRGSLHRLVEACPYKGEGHRMEDRLGDLVEAVLIPRLPYRRLGVNLNLRARKKVSVYVFTDGDWGHTAYRDDACGVERPVRALIGKLRKRGLAKMQVSLHFVRFGEKENGGLHLRRLDDFGGEDGWDIVDVKHIDTEVEYIIVGPLTRANDDIPAA